MAFSILLDIRLVWASYTPVDGSRLEERLAVFVADSVLRVNPKGRVRKSEQDDNQCFKI